MKTLVAKVITDRGAGLRTYTLFSKAGKPLKKISVTDSGQGAANAHEVMTRLGFKASLADWAMKLNHQHSTDVMP